MWNSEDKTGLARLSSVINIILKNEFCYWINYASFLSFVSFKPQCFIKTTYFGFSKFSKLTSLFIYSEIFWALFFPVCSKYEAKKLRRNPHWEEICKVFMNDLLWIVVNIKIRTLRTIRVKTTTGCVVPWWFSCLQPGQTPTLLTHTAE